MYTWVSEYYFKMDYIFFCPQKKQDGKISLEVWIQNLLVWVPGAKPQWEKMKHEIFGIKRFLFYSHINGQYNSESVWVLKTVVSL